MGGQNPVGDLARIFRVQVVLGNDADAAALAKAGWGAGKNKSRLIYVTVGTGIGGGIVFDGRLYRGVDGAHPELATRSSIPLGRFVLAASGAAGNRWPWDPRWSHSLMQVRRPIIRIANISPPSASASWRGRANLWLAGRLSARATTWDLVWPILSICSWPM